MTYPNAHLLLTIHWTNGGVPTEIGQVGLRYDSTTPATQALVDACAGAVNAFWTNATAAVDYDYRLGFLRLASIGVDGKYVPGSVAYDHNYSPVVPGGGSGGAALYRYPLQIATSSRLTTDFARGQAHQGRIYLPPVCAGMDSGYHIPSSYVNTRTNSLAQMLTTLNAAMPGPLSIFSKGTKAAPTVGAKHVVTHVNTDNVYDVQRRRANHETRTLGIPGTV